MKKSKFTEAQIVFAIKKSETGVSVEQVCRKLGISQTTFYNWKKRYGGLDPSELRRLDRSQLTELYQCISMGFASDALFDGRKSRALTVVDNYSRECLAIHVGKSLKGVDVVGVLEQLRVGAGIVPKRIQTDNGSEFISKEMDRWAYEHQVTMDYSRPGKPTDNPFVESFNCSFRDECLNAHWFLSLECKLPPK